MNRHNTVILTFSHIFRILPMHLLVSSATRGIADGSGSPASDAIVALIEGGSQCRTFPFTSTINVKTLKTSNSVAIDLVEKIRGSFVREVLLSMSLMLMNSFSVSKDNGFQGEILKKVRGKYFFFVSYESIVLECDVFHCLVPGCEVRGTITKL